MHCLHRWSNLYRGSSNSTDVSNISVAASASPQAVASPSPDTTAGHRHLLSDTSALLTWPPSALSDPESVVNRNLLKADASTDAAVAQWLSTMGQTHGLYVASNSSINISNSSGSVVNGSQSSPDSESTQTLATHYKPPTTLEDLQFALKIFGFAMGVVCVAHAVVAGLFKVCCKSSTLPM